MAESAELSIIARARDEATRALQQLQSTIGQMGQGATSSFKQVETAAQQSSKGVGGLIDTFGKLGMGVFGIKTLAESVGGLAQSFVKGNAEFERYETQFGVLMGSTTKAKDRLAELAEFGAKTPFELPELVRADKVLISFGLDSEDTAKRFGVSATQIRTTIGDVAAGTGVKFEELALTFGKFASGATGEAIARFQELGIATREQMASWGLQFSKSGELLTPAREAFTVLEQHVRGKFGGMMDAQSKTFEGMMSNLSDWWGQTQRKLMAPLFEVLKDKLQGVLDFLGSPAVMEAMEGFATLLGNAISIGMNWFGKLINLLTPVGEAFINVGGMILTFGKYLGEIIGFGDYMNDFLADLPEPLRTIAKDFGQVVEGIRAFILYIGQSIGLVENARDVLQDIPEPLRETVKFLGALAEALQRILSGQADWGSFTQVLKDFFGPEVQKAGEVFIGTIQTISQTIGELAGKLGELIGPVETAKPLLLGAAAIIAAIVVPAFIAWATAAWASATATIAALAAVSWPLIAIGAVVAALALIWINNLGDIQGKTQAVASFVGDLLGSMGEAWENLSTWLGDTGRAISKTWNDIVSFFDTAISTIKVVLSTGLSALISIVTAWVDLYTLPYRLAWQGIQDLFSWVTGESGLRKTLGDGLNALVSLVQSWITAFLKPYQDAWDGISGAFATWWASEKGLPGAIKTGLASLVTTVTEWIEAIKAPFTAAWTAVQGVFNTYITGEEGIIAKVKSGLASIVTAATEWLESLKTPFTNAWVAVKGLFDTYITGEDGIIAKVKAGLASIVTAATEWLESLKTPFTNAWTAVSGIFTGFLTAGAGAGNSLIDDLSEGLATLITSVEDWIENFLQPYRDAWTGVSGVFGPALTDLWNSLSTGLEDLIILAQGWIDRFLQPFRDAWNGVEDIFDWFIGRSIVPDMLASGLDDMIGTAWQFADDFAEPFRDAWGNIVDTANAGFDQLRGLVIGWPAKAPVLTDQQIADIMLGKMPDLKKIFEEQGRGAIGSLAMVQEWWNWPGVREGFGSFQEYAAGKGWLPKAAGPQQGPRISPSMKSLRAAFDIVRPYATTLEDAVTQAVGQMSDRVKEISGGRVIPTAEDMQKWWNDLMSDVLNEKLNYVPEVPRVPTPSKPAPVAVTSSTGGTTAPQNVTINLTGTFLATDRTLLQELARLLKPELDRLVTVGV